MYIHINMFQYNLCVLYGKCNLISDLRKGTQSLSTKNNGQMV
jgi:hypothetical protein